MSWIKLIIWARSVSVKELLETDRNWEEKREGKFSREFLIET